MTDFANFKGRARRLDDVDLPRIGHEIGVGEDELHAFMDVEAPGSAFDSQGRPRILFEPAKFYKHLPAAKRAKAQAQGLAIPAYKPGVYGKESEQYPKLIAAMKIDADAALLSCSWGRCQMMGENFHLAGYSSVDEMILAFMDDEENHIQAMVNFIVASHIDDDLRRIAALTRPTTAADCVPIVRVYNGTAYATNRYDVKFAAAHNKWRAIRDTPWSPDDEPAGPSVDIAEAPAAFADLKLPASEVTDGKAVTVQPAVAGIKPEDLPSWEAEALQLRLHDLGYHIAGYVDGKPGGGVAGALAAFQNDYGLPTSGLLDDATRTALEDKNFRRPIADERALVTAADLRKQGSPIIKAADKAQGVAAFLGGGGILAFFAQVLNSLGDAKAMLDPIWSLLTGLPGILLAIAVVGIAAYLAWQGHVAKTARVEDERTGRHNGEPADAPPDATPAARKRKARRKRQAGSAL